MVASSKNRALEQKEDQAFFDIFLTLPSFPFYRYIRQDAALLEQQKRTYLQTKQPPTFSYPKAAAFDIIRYLETLKDRCAELPPEPFWIRDLYQEKFKELEQRANLVLAITNGDDQTVTDLSKELFGRPRQGVDDLTDEFHQMLDRAHTFHTHSKPVNAELFARMVQDLFDAYSMDDWRIRMSEGSSVSVVRGRRARRPTINIPKTLQISKARAARLLTHEIEVHALRTENGRRSPLHLLHVGLGGYIRTDEGLAIFAQQKLRRTAPRHDPGFWDAWTCALSLNGTFADTFETIATARTQLAQARNDKHPEETGQDAAWRLCLRTYRGITHTETYGVGFVRDHLYRSGLLDIRAALKNSNRIPTVFFTGNIGLQHADTINKYLDYSPTPPEWMSKEIVAKHC